ncbi:hypothetical protein GCM10008101_27890 [Lysobacter xinjiangensis]|uniref:ATPase dynein-related AAA domain-containing protein n=1 Tax=Cognatilysobacter xinjiangensis TaxID=546892 RepID=A0ABQ3CBW1_9GAMM|nr:AAA family ATPase [Lysobacter xinjiangensis]GGZ72078.1 hypothetical protein GCM10008101_27890 [Lysobacter xinjiangensis]
MSDVSDETTQWAAAVQAVSALGGRASIDEVWSELKKTRPDTPLGTVSQALNNAAVNSPQRTSQTSGREPRRTDSGNRYDKLLRIGRGSSATFVPYDPAIHGTWEVYRDETARSTHGTLIRKVEEPPFNAALAIRYLERRYPGPARRTTHIVAFRTREGRHLAVDPGKEPERKTSIQLFVETVPAGVLPGRVTEYPPERTRNHHLAAHAPSLARGHQAYAVQVRSWEELDHLCDGYDGIAPPTKQQSSSSTKPVQAHPVNQPINRILFGPPGTGKTHRTVEEALRIVDPEFLERHSGERSVLKARYDELAQAGRIRFVTFHQSFSYEDFVEGIRAETAEDDGAAGGIHYRVEPGVFRQVCDAARSRTVTESSGDLDIDGRRVWKISLGDWATEGHIFDECMQKGIALLGFGYGVDLSGVKSRADIVDRLQHAQGTTFESTDYTVTALDTFIRRVKVGDLFIVSQGNLKFRAIGEVTGEYEYRDRGGEDTYTQARPVRWVRRYDPARPYTDLMENRFSQMTIYEPNASTINRDRLRALLAPTPNPDAPPEPRVLIIDEINRGNVSRIFGELITLVEPSKRDGCDEALSITLPYSRERFSVPRNVHIIATMNTADRSLAGMDVALRRRFEFVEMMPDVSVLDSIDVAGIPIADMLRVMNRRIEALLGRDYVLGHAYFLGLKADPSVEMLEAVFRLKVLPLLQEYFFADWQRIAWVLNDHRKPAHLRFIRATQGAIQDLFGSDVELPTESRLWEINDAAFGDPAAYKAIIEVSSEPA